MDTVSVKGEDDLFARFDALGIDYVNHEHPPLHTVSESQNLRGSLPGAHVKNLFLRDKKKRIWLATVLEDRDVDLKALKRRLGGSGSLSFGSPDLLMEVLGVVPGAVTPFGVINDADRRVTVVLDEGLLAFDRFNAHPLRNDRTVAIATAGLLEFLAGEGYDPLMIDFARPLDEAT